jgi:hypothetical protein
MTVSGARRKAFPNDPRVGVVQMVFNVTTMIRDLFLRRNSALAGVVLLLFCAGPLRAAETIEFNRDIRPILSDRCFRCHGPDKAARKSGLRLDLAEEAYAERKKSHKHLIVPGKPGESLVCQKIFATDPDDVMPPPDANLALTQKEKETIRTWIAQGGKYQPHWAFIPLPDAVAVPKIKNKKWPRNDIDRFILARLEKAGIKPSAEAERSRWLRRVTYDLTGLPPAPGEIDAFLADKTPGAYEKVVDRLLASKHYGERMAVPWLDAARYADSYGYQSDQLCPTWPFRDWVVNAFNQNMRYNEFLTEQLGGDLLPGATREQRVATAFNRVHRQTNEGGSIEEEWRLEYVSDRVHTFGSSMLALTFECSHCHDHKYDPLTQRDYYSLSAFFNSIDEYGLYNDTAHVPTPSVLLPTPEQEKRMDATSDGLDEKNSLLGKAVADAEPGFQEWLKRPDLAPEMPGLNGSFSFDAANTNGQFANAANSNNFSSNLRGNSLVPGRSGQAIQFTGDDEVSFPGLAGGLQPWSRYTILCWIKIPETLTNGTILHRLEGTDVGFHGAELKLDQGRLMFIVERFWPGNALAVRALEPVLPGHWTQIGVSCDGSGKAQGLTLFANGEPAKTEILRDRLTKSPEAGSDGFAFGALFRSFGFKGGLLDDLVVYDRPLSPIEAKQVFDGHSLRDALAARDAGILRRYYLSAISPTVAQAAAGRSEALQKYFAARNTVLETSVMEELPAPRPAYALARGRYDAPKTPDKLVTRSTPAILPPFPNDYPRDRLGLADWLTDPHHPLTARVAMNRFWQTLFGRGIVATPENFGAQGAAPSHPELLDWLARDFIASGWNVKATVKKIVLSATYRQDSRLRPDLKTADPENILLARGPSQRLSAEMIRDTALAASGLLDEDLGGPPVSPYMPGDLWRESNSMSPGYHQSVGGALYRRSLYTIWKRTAPMPNMMVFDAPSREVCVLKRTPTSSPQQAFVLLNDTQFVEAARVLAEKAIKQAGPDPAKRIQFVFKRLAGRDPDKEETALLNDLMGEQREIFAKEHDRAGKLVAVGDSKRDPALDAVDLATVTTMAQAVLNLDATVWKR